MRRIKKAILGLSFITVMGMGGVGVSLAANPQQAVNDTEISADAGSGDTGSEEKAGTVIDSDINLDKANRAYINQVYTRYDKYIDKKGIYIRFDGAGCKFYIYVNGKFFKEVDNSDSVNEDNPAPGIYNENMYFSQILSGGTYKIEVIPYLNTENGPIAGESESSIVSVPSINITSISQRSCAVDKGNGYSNGGSIHISWSSDNAIDGTQYEIQRKDGKGAWKTIAKTDNMFYDDSNAAMGKKYQYRVRVAAGKNEYAQTAAGKWNSLKNVKLNVGAVNLVVSYEGVGDGVGLSMSGSGGDICSGYEIYRSKNKTKGYKKIARTAYASYVDKKVQKGTYYYKARAYYYDETSGKIYYGDFTEPKGVKLVLGELCMSAKQTGKSQAVLEWNPVKGVSSYEVWYKTGAKGDAYKLYKTTKKTELKMTGLTDSTEYSFRVRAKKDGSAYYTSSDCSCYIGFQAPEPQITKNKVTSNKAKTAVTVKSTIKWDRIYGAKQIRIVGVTNSYFDENGNYIPRTEKVLKTLKGTATSYTLTTKITGNNNVYDNIKVVAVNGDDEAYGGFWDRSYIKLNDTKKLTVKRANHAGSVISWKAVPGATKYNVYRVTPYGYRVLIGQTNKCKFKDLNVTPGVQYTYSIEAENDKVNLKSLDNTVIITYTHKLGTPKVRSVKNAGSKKVTIKWNRVNYAKTYVVYRATGRNGKYKKVATVKNGKTTYTDKRLKKGATYYYRVKAIGKNAAGFSVSSVMSAKKSVEIKK